MDFYGIKTNPYDTCVANEIINGKQITVTWNVYDLKVPNKDPSQITTFACYVSSIYGKSKSAQLFRYGS